jgi:DNA polymerase III delta prime subunit
MIDIVDVNVKNISGSNIQRAIENNTSTNNTNEIEIDAKIEALISSFEKSIDNELKEYVKKETFDYTNTKINHTINELRSNFTDEINKLKNDIILSKPTIVKIERHEVDTLKKIDLGIQHKKFPQLCRAAAARLPDGHHLNIWLYGPAGTGKSTAGQNLAQALGREFVSDGKLTSDFQVLGYKNTQGDYVRTKFRDAYEFGYVYMADEIDGSLPDALIGFNGGLANHVMAFPDQMIKRHRNFIFIGAANTTGTGGTIEYVGRMKQDAAFNNRFIYIDWPIDDALEEHMAEGEINWLNIVRRVRANVASHKITGHLVTPRATLFGATLIRSGFTVAEAAEMTLKQGLSNAQWKLASQGIVL